MAWQVVAIGRTIGGEVPVRVVDVIGAYPQVATKSSGCQLRNVTGTCSLKGGGGSSWDLGHISGERMVLHSSNCRGKPPRKDPQMGYSMTVPQSE
ncbi:hypothetical protein Tco_0281737 [Tanacetum coccineum]